MVTKLQQRTRRGPAGQPQWDELSEAPRLDVPDQRAAVWKRVSLTAMVWACLVTWPILAFGLVALAVAQKPTPDTTLTEAADGSSLSKATAHAAVLAWLDATPSQLPGGRILTVDDVTHADYRGQTKDEREAVTGQQDQTTLDIVTFTLVDPNGVLYRSSVSVAVDPRGFATPVSSPSLERIPTLDSTAITTTEPWPGRETIAASESVTAAVEQWAYTYAGGNSDKLRLAVGDPDGTHLYIPLPKMNTVTAATIKATIITPAGKAPGGQVVAARVDLTLGWAGQANPEHRGATTSLDVLVERADTAAPLVTAWGAPGTGPTLVRYQNAATADGRQPMLPSDDQPITPQPSTPASTPRN